VCHGFGFDPSEVILEKLAINERKYPVEKAKGGARKLQ
jgi:dCTP diphosphatase